MVLSYVRTHFTKIRGLPFCVVFCFAIFSLFWSPEVYSSLARQAHVHGAPRGLSPRWAGPRGRGWPRPSAAIWW